MQPCVWNGEAHCQTLIEIYFFKLSVIFLSCMFLPFHCSYFTQKTFSVSYLSYWLVGCNQPDYSFLLTDCWLYFHKRWLLTRLILWPELSRSKKIVWFQWAAFAKGTRLESKQIEKLANRLGAEAGRSRRAGKRVSEKRTHARSTEICWSSRRYSSQDKRIRGRGSLEFCVLQQRVTLMQMNNILQLAAWSSLITTSIWGNSGSQFLVLKCVEIEKCFVVLNIVSESHVDKPVCHKNCTKSGDCLVLVYPSSGWNQLLLKCNNTRK